MKGHFAPVWFGYEYLHRAPGVEVLCYLRRVRKYSICEYYLLPLLFPDCLQNPVFYSTVKQLLDVIVIRSAAGRSESEPRKYLSLMQQIGHNRILP
jgi:hypothetical protein